MAESDARTSRGPLYLVAASLWKREMVRFARDRSRLFGAFGQPVLFWLLIGAGLQASFTPPGFAGDLTYTEYIYPGILMMILLFTAIFSTISVVEDRKEGFMQAVLVAPVSRSSIVVGKLLGGASMATLQGTVFLVFAYFLGIPLTPASVLGTVGLIFIVSCALTGLGFAIAWRMESTSGFHAIMNVFLLPMWLLSGAFFPASGATTWLGWVMWLNPLTYSMAGLRRALYSAGDVALPPDLPEMGVCVGVTLAFLLVTILVSAAEMRRKADR